MKMGKVKKGDLRRWSLRRKLIVFISGSILLLAILLVLYMAQMVERANRNTRELVESYARKLNNFFSEQLADIIYDGISMSYSDAVQELFCAKAAGEKEYLEEVKNFRQMSVLSGEQDNVIDILFVGNNKIPFFSKSGRGEKMYQDIIKENVLEEKENWGGFYEVKGVPENAYCYSGPTFAYAIDVFQSYHGNNRREKLGTIVYLCNLTQGSSLLLDQEEYGIEIRMAEGPVLLSNGYEFLESSMMEFKDKVRYSDWELRVMVEKAPLEWGQTMLAFLLSLPVLSCCILGVCLIIYQSIQKPLEQMVKELDGIVNVDGRVTETYNLEIGRIGRHINRMLVYQNQLIKRDQERQKIIFRMEMDKKEAELSALRAQINPHFLYNSLECVRGMALSYHAKDIEKVVVALGNIFRYSIKGKNIVNLEDELRIIKDYFCVIQHRFPNRYQLHICVKESLLQCRIPRMILQPIVENAVNHGVGKLKEGNIWITGWKEGEKLSMTVENDGPEIDQAELDAINKRLSVLSEGDQLKGVGLLNICQRISTIYGEEYTFFLENRNTGGVKVSMKIPFLLNVEKEIDEL